MRCRHPWTMGFAIVLAVASAASVFAQSTDKPVTSYLPVVPTEEFATLMERMTKAKPDIIKRQRALLDQRYDLSDRKAQGVTMARGKPVQEGVRVILPDGVTWEELASMPAEQIRDRDLFPKGFLPLPHANHPEGGMVFPHFEIDELKKQEARSHALRPRFRYSRSLPAGIPGAHLSDHAARSWRRVE